MWSHSDIEWILTVVKLRGAQIDATTADGRLVYLKLVRTDSEELKIARIFSGPLLCGDPQNHCVPILDTFPDEDDENVTYIVMPFLHPMDQPEFYWVSDVVDFVDQALEVCNHALCESNLMSIYRD